MELLLSGFSIFQTWLAILDISSRWLEQANI